MTVEEELTLSYYRPAADIHAEHGVKLVQHTETGKFYVRKILTVYNLDIFRQLQAHPVPNTPRIYELVEDNDSLIVIEEYLQGCSLQEMLEADKHFDESEVLSLTMQLCLIIQSLHHMTPPIIHRDIKPSNILLSPDHVVKLLDFNAAKRENDRETRDTVLLGTFGYAAPEQYGFAASSVQTDLYAIGALINVLLTGALPSEKPAEGPLAGIIKKCTKLDPKNRFENIDALIAALKKTERHFATPGYVSAPEQGRRRFLPPGFRKGNPLHILLALCGYTFLFWIGFSLDTASVPAAALPAYRILLVLMALAVIFFTFDYCSIQSFLPITKSSFVLIRAVGILVYDFIIFFFFIILLTILTSPL